MVYKTIALPTELLWQYITYLILQYSFLHGAEHILKHFPYSYSSEIVFWQIDEQTLAHSKNLLLQFTFSLLLH